MRGVLEASGENVLQQQLKEQGLFLIEAKDVRGSKKAYKFSSAQLAEFCREMSTLLASGVSIVRALETTADEEGLAASRRSVYLEILSELKKGTSLSEAMEMGGNFPELMLGMIRSGEGSGNIDAVMARLSLHYERENRLKQQVRSAMTYPAALLAAGLITAGVIAGMNWIVMRDNLKKQDWIESVQREGIYQQALELEDELKQVEDGISSVERLNRNLSVYPEFSGSVLRLIEVVGGGAIDLLLTDYETETGVLMFDANSKAVIDVSDYIRRLQDTGLFHTVDYTGYTYEDGVYTLSLSCTLEGKTEDQGGAQ